MGVSQRLKSRFRKFLQRPGTTVDLAPFGLENDREIYVSTTEPHGLIEATVRRSDLDRAGS